MNLKEAILDLRKDVTRLKACWPFEKAKITKEEVQIYDLKEEVKSLESQAFVAELHVQCLKADLAKGKKAKIPSEDRNLENEITCLKSMCQAEQAGRRIGEEKITNLQNEIKCLKVDNDEKAKISHEEVRLYNLKREVKTLKDGHFAAENRITILRRDLKEARLKIQYLESHETVQCYTVDRVKELEEENRHKDKRIKYMYLYDAKIDIQTRAASVIKFLEKQIDGTRELLNAERRRIDTLEKENHRLSKTFFERSALR